MKKVILFAAIAAMIGVASCNFNKKANAEQDRLDSIRIADSLRAIVVADSIQAADLLRQQAIADSIAAAAAAKVSGTVKKPAAAAPAKETPKPQQVVEEVKKTVGEAKAEAKAAAAEEKKSKFAKKSN